MFVLAARTYSEETGFELLNEICHILEFLNYTTLALKIILSLTASKNLDTWLQWFYALQLINFVFGGKEA